MSNMPRPNRFKECRSAPQNTDLLAPTFYADTQLEKRMEEVRNSIVWIRKHWDTDRRRLAERLLRWLETLAEQQPSSNESDWPPILTRWRAILSVDRNWADLRSQDDEAAAAKFAEKFAVLREYTDMKTYPLVFSRILQALRKADNSEVELMVYTIELINIDLFNYTLSGLAPSCEGSVVYRGSTMSKGDWQQHRRLFDKPVNGRFIAVPLALTSASRSRKVALQFMLKDAAKELENTNKEEGQTGEPDVLCLQAIHIIGVPDNLMEHYRRRFPQSVVSTICAVDVANVSAHPEEQEVLLRGAFFQLLLMQEQQQVDIGDEASSDKLSQYIVNTNVLEMLMVNVNRDHLSNGRLGDQDAPARALFAAMVRVARYEYCLRLCRQRGLAADEEQYAAALSQAESELQQRLRD